MEHHLGQPIPPGSKVKHVNGVTNDNRLENLFLQLPGEPTLWHRQRYLKFQCALCDGDYLIPPAIWEADTVRQRRLFCSRKCFLHAYPRVDPRNRAKKKPQGPPNADRWRAWAPRIAWAARMIPAVDPGPGGPNRLPDIYVPEVPDDLPFWGR
jgi:hypothetical protein